MSFLLKLLHTTFGQEDLEYANELFEDVMPTDKVVHLRRVIRQKALLFSVNDDIYINNHFRFFALQNVQQTKKVQDTKEGIETVVIHSRCRQREQRGQ